MCKSVCSVFLCINKWCVFNDALNKCFSETHLIGTTDDVVLCALMERLASYWERFSSARSSASMSSPYDSHRRRNKNCF